MPSFCDMNFLFRYSFEMMKLLKNLKIVTLQVRIPREKNMTGRKRVSFSASGSISGSMTVEAAIVLPLFLFASVMLLMPFRILDVERQVQAAVESVGEDIGQSAYFLSGDFRETAGESQDYGAAEEGHGAAKEDYGAAMEFLSAASVYGYAEVMVRSKLGQLPVEHVSLASSSLLEDGETVSLVVDYDMRLPFSVFGIEAVHRTNISYHRAWIGRDAISSGLAGEDDDQIVYIGKNSTRYHKIRTCHYLYNQLSTVAADKIEYYRNKNGRCYTPCGRCGDRAGSVVYIMPSGEHYHSSQSCTAILAYVQAVLKSEVEYLGACSYCWGKE